MTYVRWCRKTSSVYYYTRNSIIKSEVHLSKSPPRWRRRIKRLASLTAYGWLKDSLYDQYRSKGSTFWSDDWVICWSSHCNRSLQTLLVLWKDTQRRYHCTRCAPLPCGFSLHSPARTTFRGHELCLISFHAWCGSQHAQNSRSQTLMARLYSLWYSNGDR